MISVDVFYIIFDNVLLKDSAQISLYLINFIDYAPPNKRSLESRIRRFPILLFYWSPSRVSTLFLAGKNVPRVFVCILRDPGAVSRVGRKGTTKVLKYGQNSPWVLTLTELFPKIQADAGSSLGTKKLCIIVSNGQTVSPQFFWWVRTWRLLSRRTCPVRSPSVCVRGKFLFSTFLTRNEGTSDKSKIRLGCYQREQFDLPRGYCVFDGSQCIVNNRNFKMLRRRESQISNSFTRQNNNFARASRFFAHFFAVNCTTTPENA